MFHKNHAPVFKMTQLSCSHLVKLGRLRRSRAYLGSRTGRILRRTSPPKNHSSWVVPFSQKKIIGDFYSKDEERKQAKLIQVETVGDLVH